MTDIGYHQLDDFLQSSAFQNKRPAVFLIYGDELLYKTVLEKLLTVMLPGAARSLNYEPVDGALENIFDVIERMNTFSLQAGAKVVAMLDARLFHSRQDAGQLFEKLRGAAGDRQPDKAVEVLIGLLALLDLALEEADPAEIYRRMGIDPSGEDNPAWLGEHIQAARVRGRRRAAAPEADKALMEAIEKGFPRGHYLLITTEVIDKRRVLFKTISRLGVTIDCSVPLGERKADRQAQQALLKEHLRRLLARSDKQMDPPAFQALYAKTGFDLRTFTSSVEKLISFTGERLQITFEDVNAALERTKKDPIFELTNALADRNISATLHYLQSLLADQVHPLQILAALVNQTRRLLVAKSCVESSLGNAWQAGMRYPQFTTQAIQAVKAYDAHIGDQRKAWLRQQDSADAGRRPSKAPAASATDLSLIKNPRSLYPVYQLFLKTEHFAKAELIEAMQQLYQADRRLKSSGQNPQRILEQVLFAICARPQARHAPP